MIELENVWIDLRVSKCFTLQAFNEMPVSPMMPFPGDIVAHFVIDVVDGVGERRFRRLVRDCQARKGQHAIRVAIDGTLELATSLQRNGPIRYRWNLTISAMRRIRRKAVPSYDHEKVSGRP